jgi:hypothetical protein
VFQQYFVNLFLPYLNPKGLLIDPCDRLRFAVPLLLYSMLLEWGLASFYDLVAGSTGPPLNLSLRAALIGGLWGGAHGVLDWLLLRRYIPDPKWIVAGMAGSILFHEGIATITNILVESGQFAIQWDLNYFLVPSQDIYFLAQLIASPLSLVSGLLEWLVLRRFVVSAAWWIALPLFSYYLTLGLDLQYYFGGAAILQSLRLDINTFLQTISILVFSIGLCVLVWSRGQQTRLDQHMTASPLTSVPQINGLWQTSKLVAELQRRLTTAWQVELSYPEPLIYLLGVDRNGTITDCLPANQTAETFIDQTPLPLLIASTDVAVDSQPSLARIQVSFDSLGHLQIRNCRSVSIVEMAAVLLLLGTFISLYPTWWLLLIRPV